MRFKLINVKYKTKQVTLVTRCTRLIPVQTLLLPMWGGGTASRHKGRDGIFERWRQQKAERTARKAVISPPLLRIRDKQRIHKWPVKIKHGGDEALIGTKTPQQPPAVVQRPARLKRKTNVLIRGLLQCHSSRREKRGVRRGRPGWEVGWGGLEGDERKIDVSAVWRPAHLSCESEREPVGSAASRLMRPSAERPLSTSCPHIDKIHASRRQRPSASPPPSGSRRDHMVAHHHHHHDHCHHHYLSICQNV